jgi:hypothetical protein
MSSGQAVVRCAKVKFALFHCRPIVVRGSIHSIVPVMCQLYPLSNKGQRLYECAFFKFACKISSTNTYAVPSQDFTYFHKPHSKIATVPDNLQPPLLVSFHYTDRDSATQSPTHTNTIKTKKTCRIRDDQLALRESLRNVQ